jgi:large subunit ribosomal protein L25
MPASLRSAFGKGASRQLRMNELTPAVLYSGGKEAMPLQLDSTELFKNLVHIHGRNAVITLAIDGDDKGERHVLVKEVQKNPINEFLIHVDFLEIELERPMVFGVPLKFVGTAKGVDLGGDLHIHAHTVKMHGAPLDIPDSIEVSVRHMARGDALTFGDLALPEKVEMLNNRDDTCVSVS